MKKWVLAILLSCNAAQADMLEALKAYENKDYLQAQQHFSNLLPLGNEIAAFNLGAMAFQGEGQEKDLSEAIAYFMLAIELKHPQAKALLPKLVDSASAQQLELAYQRFEALKQQVVISGSDLQQSYDLNMPEPIKRVPPEYPLSAAKKGQFGYVALRFLVDEDGKVTAIDTIDAYPKNVFERSAVRAVKNWRYEPSEQKHLMQVRLDYSLEGGVKVTAVEDAVTKLNLWPYAVAGSPQHQLALGMLLSLVEIQSGNSYRFNGELPVSDDADFSIFESRAKIKADFDDFWGVAEVTVAKDGTILEQIKGDFDARSVTKNLVGLKLSGKIEADKYRLVRRSDSNNKRIYVSPLIETSFAMSGRYWWEQAAKNGSLEAQRIMAAYDKEWEHYLLSQQDAQVLAWTGTRLILEGQRERGLQLLEQAIAKNYKPAAEMKQQFM
ncbi:TonB family protein [Alishewanella sp. d11]|uniref:TonB family protein n=1 Tax=Alishewanella sp. d11 TaxID=3414030 RepID=UPI003BF8A7EA